MKLVLLSGGSGKRLWPLSNDSRSKQFLRILSDGRGHTESMVQRVWRQLKAAGMTSSAYLTTNRMQSDIIFSQLGEVPMIIEPERRDTFPAIALAASYLYSIAGAVLNETVVAMPIDSFVSDAFFDTLAALESALDRSSAEVALIGVKPGFPSEKYGYILPDRVRDGWGGRDEPGARVRQFVEKPDRDAAERLIGEGALWNCGVFAFKLNTLINELIRRGLPIRYEEMFKQYARLRKTSFDYEMVESMRHRVVISYSGEWKDLGTWNTLTEEMNIRVLGKGVVSDDSHHTHLINELDIPVTVLGLSNVVVAASPDGILVSDKSSSPRVKEVMKDFIQRPMYEERRWGWYKVLDYKQYAGGAEMLTKRICVLAGHNLSYQTHDCRSEVWTVVSGEGKMVLNDKIWRIGPGAVLTIPVGARHSLRASTDLELIEVQRGTRLAEEDIVRLLTDWDEIVEQCTFEDRTG